MAALIPYFGFIGLFTVVALGLCYGFRAIKLI